MSGQLCARRPCGRGVLQVKRASLSSPVPARGRRLTGYSTVEFKFPVVGDTRVERVHAVQDARHFTWGSVMSVDLSMPILVVDDYNTMIRIIRNLLKQLGFEDVDDASDGSAALALMQQKKYGLVISDWNMEPMTGYELLKEVRSAPTLAKTPFIMVTAESKTENVIAAKKAGVNNYIVKPFNAQTLKTKIEAVFAD
jgi:two-component system chemotaxis response regulator CheY